MREVVVVGGGIAGVEAAMTVARTVPRAKVTLVSQWQTLRVLPQLVYVPFGASPEAVEIRLNRALARDGIKLVVETCVHVDVGNHLVHLASGQKLRYEALIIASGTTSQPSAALRLRTLEDALRIRDALEALVGSDERDRTILLKIPATCSWSPPAFEFALLLAQWRREIGAEGIRITMEIESSEPLNMFNYEASRIVHNVMDYEGIEVLTHVASAQMDDIPGNVIIDFDEFTAHRVHGLPPLTGDGFYQVDEHGRAAPDVYVVGDAAAHPYKSGFSVGWQARRIAQELGGDLSLLGTHVDGIPIHQCEYQMDLGEETLCVRFHSPHGPDSLFMPNVQSTRVIPGRPDKLAGTLLRPYITDFTTSLSAVSEVSLSSEYVDKKLG